MVNDVELLVERVGKVGVQVGDPGLELFAADVG